jgi:hypothetical protein
MSDVKEFAYTVLHTNVRKAIDEALEIHGPLTTDDVRAMVILVEEVGELAAEVLKMSRATSSPFERRDALKHAIKEAAQVAAVATLLIVNLERK